MRKIDEVKMKFSIETTFNFSRTRECKKKNSIVLEVRKAIHKEGLDVWKEKLKQLRNLKASKIIHVNKSLIPELEWGFFFFMMII
jgi:hypothetical protein